MAAEGNIDPMHQFRVEPIVPLHIGPYDVSFTNSSAWMLAGLALIFGFMLLGMKRQLVPGRWQMAVEGLTGFIDNLARVNIGPEGKKFVPYLFSLFSFILVANFLGLMPFGIIPGVHSFTTTSQFSITGVLAVPYLLAASYLAPRIGVGLFLAALITGQLTGGMMLDHLGAFGATVRPIDPVRVVGIGMLLAGVILVRGVR